MCIVLYCVILSQLLSTFFSQRLFRVLFLEICAILLAKAFLFNLNTFVFAVCDCNVILDNQPVIPGKCSPPFFAPKHILVY